MTIKKVLPNNAMTGITKSQTSTNRHSLVLSNTSGEVTNRFTDVCRITLSTFKLINNIAEQQGTWFNIPRAHWYKLDGFLMKKGQRHRRMGEIKVLEETGLSDHKPVMIITKSKMTK